MSCCKSSTAPATSMHDTSMKATEATFKLVQERYASHAKATVSDNASNPSNAAFNEKVAAAFGYSKEDLESIPRDSNLGVSCGNPLAGAGLKEGEITIDLGSGAGLDVFLSSKKVGPTGHSYGVDMTEEMIHLATKHAQTATTPYKNVTFIHAHIHSIPLPPSTANCITSNCVINLVPAPLKPQVFIEVYRLLKPGGRVAISDILAKKELSEEIKKDIALYVGCVAGASTVEEYQAWLENAGFKDVVILNTERDLNVYKEGILSSGGGGAVEELSGPGCCGAGTGAGDNKTPSGENLNQSALMKYDLNEWTGAYQIYAVKPLE